jgi:tryptophan aminotransferase
MRIGFASGPEPLLNAIDQYVCILTIGCFKKETKYRSFHQTATSNLQTSSLTQAIVHKLLDAWGYEGFRIHTEQVSAFYRDKRDIFEAAIQRHLTGLAEWSSPEAGMFFW